jgi:hypothetical protein
MPAARTYEPIQTYTVTGSPLLGTTGVTFSSIPQTYTDLIVVQNIFTTSLPAVPIMRVGNGSVDAGTNYSSTSMSGSGGSAATGRNTNQTAWGSILAHTGTGGGMYRSQVMNYSNTTTYKTVMARYDNKSYGGIDALVQRWGSTAAINTIQVLLDRAEYYGVGCTFTLYGIKAA